MARFKTTINKFNGGIAEDTFAGFSNQFEFAKHMDNFSQDGRLRPYRSPESDQTSQTAIGHMTYVSHDSNLYGLGTKSASANAKLYKKGSSIITDNWEAVTTGEASGGAAAYNMLLEYKGALYFWRSISGGTGTIGKHDIDSPSSGDVNSWNTVTATNIGPGFSYELNDVAYFAYDNKLAMLDGTTFTADTFILPDEFQIVSLDSWNNYLAIGVKQVGGLKKSKVFFWNTIDADPSFVKDIPEGVLVLMRNTGDELVALTITGGSATTIDGALFFFVYNGGEFIERGQYIRNNDNNVSTMDRLASVKQGQLYFGARLGTDHGIWRFGFFNNQYSLTLDRFVTTDNSETFSGTVAGNIEFVGDYLFAVHTANGTITRSNDQNTHSVTGIYRTLKLDAGGKDSLKKLEEVSITTASLPSGASVVVKYKVDDSGSFITLFTHDTDSKVKRVFNASEAVPSYTYIQFQCEVTGFAEITELSIIGHDVPNEIEN